MLAVTADLWSHPLVTRCGASASPTPSTTTIMRWVSNLSEISMLLFNTLKCLFSFLTQPFFSSSVVDTRVKMQWNFQLQFLRLRLEPFPNSNCYETLFISVQWEQNEGNCGVCGDAYNLRSPRPHEAGGEYGKGIISRRYAAGQVINCTLHHAAVKMFFLFV